MMIDYRLGKIDWESEARFLLECAAGTHDTGEQKWTSIEAICASYTERCSITEEEIAALCGAYHAIAAIKLPGDARARLFGPVSEEQSAAGLLLALDRARARGCSLTGTLALLLEMDEDTGKSTESFLAALTKEDLSGTLKWMCVEALYGLDDLLNEFVPYIDKAWHALSPYTEALEGAADRWTERMRARQESGTVGDYFTQAGLKLDDQPLLLRPSPCRFNAIGMQGDAVTLPGDQRLTVECGVFVDEICGYIRRRQEDEGALLRFLHALDDKNRLSILRALMESPRNGRELAELTGLKPATISHHMDELVSATLVSIEKRGVSILYALNGNRVSEGLDAVKRSLS